MGGLHIDCDYLFEHSLEQQIAPAFPYKKYNSDFLTDYLARYNIKYLFMGDDLGSIQERFHEFIRGAPNRAY